MLYYAQKNLDKHIKNITPKKCINLLFVSYIFPFLFSGSIMYTLTMHHVPERQGPLSLSQYPCKEWIKNYWDFLAVGIKIPQINSQTIDILNFRIETNVPVIKITLFQYLHIWIPSVNLIFPNFIKYTKQNSEKKIMCTSNELDPLWQ